MKLKRILRFYFSAERLNGMMDKLIAEAARRTFNQSGNCLANAEKICAIIADKISLCNLYDYLDGVMRGLSEGEREALCGYALSRRGLSKLESGERRKIRRAAVKFVRHAAYIGSYSAGIETLKRYYCVIPAAP